MSVPTALVASPTDGEVYVAGPFNIVSRVTGGQSNGVFELYHFTLGPCVVDYHVHNKMDETIMVLEGQIEFNVVGKKTSRPAGSVAFIPRGLHHGFTNHGPGTARVMIMFTPSGRQDEYFRELQKLFAAPKMDTAALQVLQKKYDQELMKPD